MTCSWGQDALNSHVRKKFRGISNELTKKIGCLYVADGAENSNDAEVDHAVVLALVHNHILNNDFSAEQLEEFLKQNMIGVRVTRQQHRALSKSTMPSGWKFGDDVLARYEISGIHVRKN